MELGRKKRALITGISGQDGSYLAEFLLREQYEVHGIVRRVSTTNLSRIEHLASKVELHDADMLDQSSLDSVVANVRPDEVYNLAAQSFVGVSWGQPVLTAEVTGLGVARLLDAVRKVDKRTRFYQASSSEMFGSASAPQNELTQFHPRSPYGVAKVYAHHLTVNYRESYGMFACSGVLFNHESPRRGLEFVTRKITDGVARIKHGLQHQLGLGNLDARRDWGFAGDYVRAMWLMLQQSEPTDYVIGTGETHTVREFVDCAFRRAGLDWNDYVYIDPQFLRPAEVDLLLADPYRANHDLDWTPKATFTDLVNMMTDADLLRVGESQGHTDPIAHSSQLDPRVSTAA